MNWIIADYINPNDNTRHLAIWPQGEGDRSPICLLSPKELETEEDMKNAELIINAVNEREKMICLLKRTVVACECTECQDIWEKFKIEHNIKSEL